LAFHGTSLSVEFRLDHLEPVELFAVVLHGAVNCLHVLVDRPNVLVHGPDVPADRPDVLADGTDLLGELLDLQTPGKAASDPKATSMLTVAPTPMPISPTRSHQSRSSPIAETVKTRKKNGAVAQASQRTVSHSGSGRRIPADGSSKGMDVTPGGPPRDQRCPNPTVTLIGTPAMRTGGVPLRRSIGSGRGPRRRVQSPWPVLRPTKRTARRAQARAGRRPGTRRRWRAQPARPRR